MMALARISSIAFSAAARPAVVSPQRRTRATTTVWRTLGLPSTSPGAEAAPMAAEQQAPLEFGPASAPILCCKPPPQAGDTGRIPFRHPRGPLCYPSAMFSERWRVWAVRVVGRVCEDIRSEEATFAIDLIVRVAKRARSGLPKRDAVIIAAIYMPENQAAVSKVAEGLDVSPRAAEVFLDRVRRVAIEVATEEGLQEIAERGRRVRMRYLAGP
jgi:hypothetical protein